MLPTETVYGVGALATNAEAVDRLRHSKSRKGDHPLPLAIRGIDEAIDYSPSAGGLFNRLARRCWPGPVTLVVDASESQSLLHQLPEVGSQSGFPSWDGRASGSRIAGLFGYT